MKGPMIPLILVVIKALMIILLDFCFPEIYYISFPKSFQIS